MCSHAMSRCRRRWKSVLLPAPVRAELTRLLHAIAHGEDVEAHVRATIADASGNSGPG